VRTYHTGLIRKRVTPVMLHAPNSEYADCFARAVVLFMPSLEDPQARLKRKRSLQPLRFVAH
jgi:hypothetical protein